MLHNQDETMFKKKIMGAGADAGEANKAYKAVNEWCQNHI